MKITNSIICIIVSFILGVMTGYSPKPQEPVIYVSRFQEPKIGMDFDINGELYKVNGINWELSYSYEQKETVPELNLKFLKLTK